MVSMIDTQGTLTYANRAFMSHLGRSEVELIGRPHRQLRHADMPDAIYELMWSELTAHREFFSYLLYQDAGGAPLWVFSSVYADRDAQERVIGYHGVHRQLTAPVSARIRALFARVLEAERQGGKAAALRAIDAFTEGTGRDYSRLSLDIHLAGETDR